jgi:hypothetical protein
MSELRLPAPPVTDSYYIIIVYSATQAASVPLLVDGGSGYRQTPSGRVALGSGRHESIGWLGVTSPRRVLVKAVAGRACVHAMRVLTLHAG